MGMRLQSDRGRLAAHGDTMLDLQAANRRADSRCNRERQRELVWGCHVRCLPNLQSSRPRRNVDTCLQSRVDAEKPDANVG